MRRPIRCISHAFAAAALVCAATVSADDLGAAPSGAADALEAAPTGEQMALDLVVVRPLSLAGTVLGAGIFIVALPFNALTLNFKDPARRLVLEPAKYTFVRKLGDLD
jgi:hypothetical protein